MRRLVNRHPGAAGAAYLAALPFIVLIAAYLMGSAARLADNPSDKLLPAPSTLAAAIQQVAFTEDVRSGDIILWIDTASSLTRLGMGIAAATAIGLAFGIAIGLIPYVRATLAPFVAVLSMIPPLSVLPILFIVFGLGELAKVVLVAAGITPFLIRDLSVRVAELPGEQLIKAQTLGANTWQMVVRIVLPQVLPRLIGALRLSLGPAWLFLIAAEAIAATEGLGYRIFLMRRYLAMDVILPYVAWITLLAFMLDLALARLSAWLFAWARPA
ncbi:MAG: ABC transporter permease subunit [Rhodospirillaceae bacterium]|nr:ABC transporter permease subunit [Rhodospirillaceae bacterium]